MSLFAVPAGRTAKWIVFAVTFCFVRMGLWYAARRFVPSHPRAEQPDVLLSLALAPVASVSMATQSPTVGKSARPQAV